MANETIQIDTIDQFNKMAGKETLHPLVSVVEHQVPSNGTGSMKLRYGVYALFLKYGEGCIIRYGREKYDYQEGTIVCFKPGDTIELEWDELHPLPPSIALLFHPDLIYGTSLGRHIGDYTFFDYDQHEALHLSEREQHIIADTLESIHEELQHPVDLHSRDILTDRIKLVLDYCLRFYDRQFITRHRANSSILTQFKHHLSEYFSSGEAQRQGLPSVAYFADKACLSTGYFGDLIKKETGQTVLSLIHQHVIDQAKRLVLDSSLNFSQISNRLGFQYPQHFTRLFKRKVGMTPNDFRTVHSLR